MVASTEGTSTRVDLDVRCRHCPACLRWRRSLWTYRAKVETALAYRTWFCTYTLTPEHHYKALCEAARRGWLQGADFEALSRELQFAHRHRVISGEITRYLKRVRKETGASLRYLFVAEAHEGGGPADGLPHYHALVHEVSSEAGVKKRQLERQWHLGISGAKLVTDMDQATYVCKYLAKDARSRIRASVRYGIDCLSNIPNERGGEQRARERVGCAPTERKEVNSDPTNTSLPNRDDGAIIRSELRTEL